MSTIFPHMRNDQYAGGIATGTVIRSMVVNASLAAIKILTGLFGNSYALIADGIESLNDLLASAVVLFSIRVANKPPDEDHPYGHGKAEQLGALFSSLSLLAAGGVIAYQSIQNISHRHEAPAWFTLPVLAVVVITKEILSRYALKKSDEISSSALKGDAWHHRSDAITSAAAFIGITVALVAGPGYEKADDIAALLGCAVIGYNGVTLFLHALHENMDGSPSAKILDEARAIASAVPKVMRIEKLRMKKTGLGYFMDIHVQVSPSMTVKEGHAVTHDVVDAIHAAMPAVGDIVTHLEPYEE
jgi:cation diffusion facilitator family transporter